MGKHEEGFNADGVDSRLPQDTVMRDAMWRGNGGWEIAATPALLGGIGWLVDGWLGTQPIFTIVGALLGLVGAVANQYYRYVDRMTVETAERAAARESEFGSSDGPRFGAVVVDDGPSYVLESDLISEESSP